MTKAQCFNCRIEVGVGKSMEELIEEKFPVFCSLNCSTQFPDNGTPEFDKRIEDLKTR